MLVLLHFEKDPPSCQGFIYSDNTNICAQLEENKSKCGLLGEKIPPTGTTGSHTDLQTSFFSGLLFSVCVCVSKPSLATAGHRSLVGSVRPCCLRLSSWREALLFVIPVTDTVPAGLPVERDFFFGGGV